MTVAAASGRSKPDAGGRPAAQQLRERCSAVRVLSGQAVPDFHAYPRISPEGPQ